MAENENKQENVVVEDFKRTNAKKSKKKFRHRQQNPVLAFYEDNKQYLLLFGVIVVALAAILVSILALRIPVVPVCLIIVLEAGIAVCLHDVPNQRRPVYEPSQRFGKTIQNAARITDYPFRTTPQTEKIIQRHR